MAWGQKRYSKPASANGLGSADLCAELAKIRQRCTQYSTPPHQHSYLEKSAAQGCDTKAPSAGIWQRTTGFTAQSYTTGIPSKPEQSFSPRKSTAIERYSEIQGNKRADLRKPERMILIHTYKLSLVALEKEKGRKKGNLRTKETGRAAKR